jgi:Rieske Fe-S protein
MDRRVFLKTIEGLLAGGWAALAAAGCRRPASATPPIPLERPVSVPLSDLPEEWSARPVAAPIAISDGRGGKRPLTIPGIVVRLPAPAGDGLRIAAYSLLCPHEYCPVNYVRDTRTVRLDSGGAPPAHPLLVCPCHQSVYDPLAEGRRLSGPAERGAFRFAVSIAGGEVQLGAIDGGIARLFGARAG